MHENRDAIAVKYASPTSPIRIASWVEAQCIIAEVEGRQTAADIIHAIRDVQGIDETFASSDPTEIRNKGIEGCTERLRTGPAVGADPSGRGRRRRGIGAGTAGRRPQSVFSLKELAGPAPRAGTLLGTEG